MKRRTFLPELCGCAECCAARPGRAKKVRAQRRALRAAFAHHAPRYMGLAR